MLKFFSLIFFLSPLFSVSQEGFELSSSLSQKTQKNSIVVENPDLLQALQRYFYKKTLSEKNIQKFLLENNFYESEVIQRGDSYILTNPVELIFILKGNTFFKEKEIRKFIQVDETQTGDQFYNFIKTEIQRNYQEEGFVNIKVELNTVQKNWKKWIYVDILEGDRIQIAQLKVSGVFSKANLYYERFIKNNSSSLIKKGFYSKKGLEAGYDSLISYLRGQGYLQSKIYSDRVSFKKNKAFITVNLEEGPRTIIRDIKIQNSQNLPVWEILSQMKSKVQSPLQVNILKEDLSRIKRFYQSKGYLDMDITNKGNIIQYTPGEKYVSIVIEVKEGSKAYISKLSIKGVKKAKEIMVRNLLKFQEGDILTPLKKEKSLKSLLETGLWQDVAFNEKSFEDQMEVEVLVKERPGRSLRGGLGINSQRGFTTRAYSEVTHRNLFGWGRALVARGSGQVNLTQNKPFLEYEISGRYKEVFIPGSGYQGDISLSQSKNVFKYSIDNINFVQKTQVSFFINKKIEDNLQVRWNILSFENRLEACTQKECPRYPQKIGGTGFHFVWDKRDNIFDPEKGYLNTLSIHFASPLLGANKDISFVKMDLQNQFYLTFTDHYTVSLFLNGGLIHRLKESQYLPVSRAFILGGQNSLRGYDGYIEGERIPGGDVAPIEGANEALRLKQGDFIENVLKSYYGLGKFNFRFPVFKDFKALLFYDIGFVFLQGKQKKIPSFGHSVGIGFRYQTFLIPIGLDVAYILPPKQGILRDLETYKLHFSIGW